MATLTLTPATAKPDEPVFAKFTGAKPQRLVKFWQGTVLLGSDKSGKAGNANITFAARESGTITAKDNFGHSASAMLTVTAVEPPPPVDQAPVIDPNIVVDNISQTAFRVLWNVSESAQGWVEYGTTTAYGSETMHETSFDYSMHAQMVSGLQAGTTYHFRVHAVDQAGQHVTSPDQVALTSGGEPPPPPPPPPGPEPDPVRPWPAPVTTRTVSVPSTIDATGGTDVSAALNAWLKTVPAGSEINFDRLSPTYRLRKGMLWEGRLNANHRVVGKAKFIMEGAGSDEALSTFLFRGSSHVAIDGEFTVETPGYTAWPQSSGENAHVLGLSGWYNIGPSSYIEITGVTADRPYGDFAYLEGRNGGAREPGHHVWIHHNKADHVGRQPISFINVTDVLIEHNDWPRSSYHVYDTEPNFPEEQVRRVIVRDEIVGSFAHRSGLLGFFISDRAIGSGVGSKVSDLLYERIKVAGIAADGVTGRPRALQSAFNSELAGGGVRQQRITLRDIETPRAVSDNPVLWFKDIDSPTVQRITQPLSGGTLADFPGCTNVVR